ncbi:MAG: DUF2589 domain-containing protein [Cyclobacteriaceae bacterium]
MADESTQVSPAEFSKIPLDFIIATPLLTTINAHRIAAETTLEFVKGLLVGTTQKDAAGNVINDPQGNPIKVMPTVSFKMEVNQKNANGTDEKVMREISLPLITLVKVPSLTFDSLSVSFNYNISQVVTEKSNSAQKANLEVGTKGLLSGLLSASLTGSVDHSRSSENTANRGGTLDIKIHVSESAMPAGLQKVINALVDNITLPLPNPNA